MGCVCKCYSIAEAITEIDAPIERVWSVLTDFDGYARWNPFIVHSKVRGSSGGGGAKAGGGGGGDAKAGVAAVGAVLENTMRPKPGDAGSDIKFAPVVQRFDVNGSLQWEGQLMCPGCFDGQHYFHLKSVAPNKTTVTQGEHFGGCLIGSLYCCLGCVMMDQTARNFVLMNEALKKEAERLHNAQAQVVAAAAAKPEAPTATAS